MVAGAQADTITGINFRETWEHAYCTDPTAGLDDATTTYLIWSTGDGDQWSVTRPTSGLTFGVTPDPDTTLQSRDRNDCTYIALAGIHYVANNAASKVGYRVTLPTGAGTYDVRLASGDADYANNACLLLKIYDGTSNAGTLKITVKNDTADTIAANSFYDAAGNVRTDSAWVSSNTAVQATFATNDAYIEIGRANADCTSGNSLITHVRFEPVAAPTSTPTSAATNTPTPIPTSPPSCCDNDTPGLACHTPVAPWPTPSVTPCAAGYTLVTGSACVPNP
jgi:hypothetical protein